MKKKSNNKGFSLIELIVSLAIVMIVGGSIVSFLLAGSNSYASVITNTDLQEEAQLVVNQISKMRIRDCTIISSTEDPGQGILI